VQTNGGEHPNVSELVVFVVVPENKNALTSCRYLNAQRPKKKASAILRGIGAMYVRKPATSARSIVAKPLIPRLPSRPVLHQQTALSLLMIHSLLVDRYQVHLCVLINGLIASSTCVTLTFVRMPTGYNTVSPPAAPKTAQPRNHVKITLPAART
jgi:hypothetical protein